MSKLHVQEDGSFAFVTDVDQGMTIVPVDVAKVITLPPDELQKISKKLQTHDAKFDTVKQEITYKRRAKK